jgi:hypothetical protein
MRRARYTDILCMTCVYWYRIIIVVALFLLILRILVSIHTLFRFVVLSGEGPRSRRYGRTTALRLLVQPCDEDDDDDDYFLSFS